MKPDYEAILQMFCHQDGDHPIGWDIITPFKQGEFACGTNGHFAAFIPAKLVPKIKKRDRTPNAPALIPKEFTGKWTTALADLEEPELEKALLGKNCSFCGGTERCECQCGYEHDCLGCGGAGAVMPYRIYNKVFQYDYISRIRRAFQMLGVDKVEYAETKPQGAAVFTANELKILLAPLLSEGLEISASYPKNA